MNKRFIISLGIAAVISTTMAYADSTIYTDGIGRMHFLGRDAANNVQTGTKYSNAAEQDLTKKLYEQAGNGVVNDTSYDQHPLKNYENTFPDSRFGTAKYWNTKFSNNTEDAAVESKTVKAVSTATKGKTDYSNMNQYGSTILENQDSNVVKTTAKKHWWNRK